MRRSTGVASVLLTVLAVGVAGCSGGSGSAAPTPAPTPTSASTVAVVSSRTPTATPTDPRAQVLAAVREYFNAANHAIQTGDTTRLRAITDKGCPCYQLIRHVEEDAAAGRRTPAARLRVVSKRVTSATPTVAGVDVSYESSAYAVINRDGSVERTVPAHSGRTLYTFVRYRDAWHVSQAVTVESR